MHACGATPKHMITDRGKQFDCEEFRDWARRKNIRLRYGAVGKCGSIAIIERFIRSMKSECCRRILLPLRMDEMREELRCYATWYNTNRPHQSLRGRTPLQAAADGDPPRRAYETRGPHGVKLALMVTHWKGRRHLPVVELRPAA